ncbi:hypothetical protein DOTSEDRAFT_79482 [Dothistroma septosporum NZE10]|uniref:Uncharacterized protein n=1 Tax=Dothistroma septosporum (strain NZE10 / CBS 128990) TaxID=675120 RepID=N1PQ12_DOTSN|nr:hypothetical protein DOTSEDRAFT_79482 [Dothistroma septosporum NZE10]
MYAGRIALQSLPTGARGEQDTAELRYMAKSISSVPAVQPGMHQQWRCSCQQHTLPICTIAQQDPDW